MGRKEAYLQHLADVPMFAACTKKELEMVYRAAESHRSPAGEVIVREGGRGREFFVIADGSAQVSRGGAPVAELRPGDYFGELALLDPAPRDATVTATSAMEALLLNQREFFSLLEQVPPLTRSILTGMARRLHENDRTGTGAG